MGMTEDDKRNCCLLEIQETEAKYYKTLEDIEKVSTEPSFPQPPLPQQPWIPQEFFWIASCSQRKMGEEGDPQNPGWKAQNAGAQSSIFFFIIFSDCCRLEPGWKPSCCVPSILGWESPTPDSARPVLLIRAMFADISYHSDCHGIIPLFRGLELCWLAIEANWIKRNVLLPKLAGV